MFLPQGFALTDPSVENFLPLDVSLPHLLQVFTQMSLLNDAFPDPLFKITDWGVVP